MRGFTLIEVVLSIGLLAVGLVGVMISFQGAARSSILADQTVIATNLARGALERIVANRDANGYPSTLTAIASGTYNETGAPDFPDYSVECIALEVNPDVDGGTDDFLDASPGSGYARVTATASWNAGGNKISLFTLIANYTP